MRSLMNYVILVSFCCCYIVCCFVVVTFVSMIIERPSACILPNGKPLPKLIDIPHTQKD